MVRRFLLRVLIAVACSGLFGVAWFAWWYRDAVAMNPGDHISRGAIQGIISQESPVFYADGRERLGVFFSQEHRIYVPYDEIPQAWIDAIVAAEDKNFFHHRGVDPEGIARAAWLNLKAGSVVAGGSTLTQQTAKNLYYRPDRSMRSKWDEAVNALRLERHHEKEEILEYYANQFHVSANGRGLGIGARYFFDKDVAELTVQECAFLAGLVKAPSWYNPFIARSEERREQARSKAQARTRYVLGRMVEEGTLSPAVYESLADRPIPFRRGTFRYESNVVLDAVQRRLEQSPFPELFEAAGIDNPSTAGIQIRTTLDADAQRAATYGLWHHLTDVGLAMEGAAAGALVFVHTDRTPTAKRVRQPEPREFFYARVVGSEGGEVHLDVAGWPGVLDADAVDRAAGVLARAAEGDRWARTGEAHRSQVRSALSPGDVVWVSVRPEPAEGAERLACDLELRPELQGAVLLVEDGAVRAMVGGNDNKNFNRALDAHRQLGSTWKSLVFASALQLGWAPTDLLDNRRAVFPFEATFYYPRPDHASDDRVSMAWAGVRSENLATIWLLYHLLDRLTEEQVRQLAEQVGMAPGEDESRQEYIVRIRDGLGVIALRSRVEAGLLNAVREEVASELEYSRWPEDALEVRSLHYGMGFDRERQRVEAMSSARERTARLDALTASMTWLERRAPDCQQQVDTVRAALAPPEVVRPSRMVRWLFGGETVPEPPSLEPVVLEPEVLADLWVRPGGERVQIACGQSPGEDWGALDAETIARLQLASAPVIDDDPLVDGRLHASSVRALRSAIDGRKARSSMLDPWDPELLFLHPDFRTMLALKFLAAQAGALGVEGDIPPVLSLPLGAVDVRLEEAVTLYSGMLTGLRWRIPGERYEAGAVPGTRVRRGVPASRDATSLISEIRDRDGNVLYRAVPEVVQASDPVSAALTEDILRNVVRHGTGQRARAAAPGWPLAGKTGTTNDYRNAAFLGQVPRVADGEVVGRYTLGVYVGYDDNRRMARGTTRLGGPNGALPAWAATVAGLRDAGLMGEAAPEVLEPPEGYSRVTVAVGTGAPVESVDLVEEDPVRSILVHGDRENLHRRFAPLGRHAQVEDDQVAPLPLPPQEDLPTDTAGPPAAEDADAAAEEQNPGGLPVSEPPSD